MFGYCNEKITVFLAFANVENIVFVLEIFPLSGLLCMGMDCLLEVCMDSSIVKCKLDLGSRDKIA